ncbi:MAG: esterase [Elusimicrobiota bacterium]
MSFGPLEAIEFPASSEAPVIVCLHGYGADCSDLAFLGGEMRLGDPVRWLFPNGPLQLSPYGGRAWFPIDEEALLRVQVEDSPIELSKAAPAGLDSARTALLEFLTEAKVGWENLILGGFSQGAMLSLEAALAAPKPPKGLFLLSGTLVDEPALRAKAASLGGQSFFQSHGRQDPLLSYACAERLYAVLKESGWKGELFSFNGGHALPADALEALRRYLTDSIEDTGSKEDSSQ